MRSGAPPASRARQRPPSTGSSGPRAVGGSRPASGSRASPVTGSSAPAQRARNTKFFEQAAAGGGQQAGVAAALRRAAETGQLNLSQRGLVEVPAAVCDFDNQNVEGCNWWEQCTITKVDLSNNELQELPPSIGQLSDCTIFIAQGNQLQALPSELFGLPLKSLVLAKNRIAQVPDALSCSTALVELVLSENALTALPHDLSALGALEVLDISKNQLQQLPRVPQQLKRLNASENRVESLSLGTLPRLSELSLGKNHLKHIELGCLAGLQQLVSLDLSENSLAELPRLPEAKALDTVAVAFNRLTALPPSLCSCQGLSVLLAHNNHLTSLPDGLAELKQLNTLDVSNNDLAQLPLELGLITSLKRLNVQGNPLRSLPMHALRGNTEQLKRCLRERLPVDLQQEAAASHRDDVSMALRAAAGNGRLVLEGMGLEDLPLGMELPERLEVFNACRNTLVSISVDLQPYQDTLQELRLDSNRLQLLPECIGALTSLRHLSAAKNQLQSLPRSPGWPRLRFADFSVNQLERIPPSLAPGNAPELDELRLSSNRITSLSPLGDPPVRCRSALSVLDLEANKISDVPLGLPEALPRLTTLLLANNDLPGLPPSFGDWASLRSVTLHGNPLRQIRPALVQKGWPAVQEFLRTRVIDEEPPPDSREPGGGEAAQQQQQQLQRLEAMRTEVARLQEQLAEGAAGGHSQAQLYAMKKHMQKSRAELLRAERELQAKGCLSPA